MSYILNALRKSERERQTNQPESVTERILVQQPRKNRKTVILIAMLLVSNLLVIAFWIWFSQRSVEEPAKTETAKKTVVEKIVAKPVQATIKPAEVEVKPVQEVVRAQGPLVKPVMPKSSSIEELAALKQLRQEEKKSSAASTKHDVPLSQLSATAKIKQQKEAKKQDMPADKEIQSASETQGVVRSEINKPESAAVVKKEIPFLRDLSYEFRRSVPKMTINAFAYAVRPEDRFVIIDMVKYKTGQTTKDSVEIKEIRADSLVVNYAGQTFRIERP